jgi:eukaryotic-like serine/threonine-protein kinase
LAAAHAAGILHRDVKPENILAAKNGYAKLADFGLAKLFDPDSEQDATRTITLGTRPGVVMGTIAYMSPEQAAGRSVDARSDIFSFGIVLHEILAGQRPFRGASELEVLQAIRHGAPERLSSDVPVSLRAIVEKALEKDPVDRYQTMRDMVVDLRRFSRQTAEALPGVPAAGGAWPLRTRMAATAVLGLALGFVAGRVFWVKPAPRLPTSNSSASQISSELKNRPRFRRMGRRLHSSPKRVPAARSGSAFWPEVPRFR